MWYYTAYALSIKKEDWEYVGHKEQKKYNDEIYKKYDEYPNDSSKWYEHSENMLEYSKLYPKLLFILEWNWEESDDMWYKYYKNWKMQECYWEVVYPEYDEKKLK